jgi:hypothetical protein
MPMAAMASTRLAGDTICAAHGVQPAPTAPTPGKSTPTQGCQHCGCPVAFTATPPPALQASVAVTYPIAPPDLTPHLGPAPGRGLAAPPPPSQGPPRFSA